MSTQIEQQRERREFGAIFKNRRSPYWQIRWSVDGKPKEKSTGSTDRRVAEKQLATIQAQLGVPGAYTDPSTKRTTFGDMVAVLRDDYKRHHRRSLTVKVVDGQEVYGGTCESSIKRLTSFFGGWRALAIDVVAIGHYWDTRLAAPYHNAEGSLGNDVRILKRMIRLARRAGLLPATYAIPDFEIPDPQNAREGYFEADDFRAVLAELPEPLRPVMEFCYLTGWRVAKEVLPLTWDRVDFKQGTVRLARYTTKNKDARVFPFDVVPALGTLLERQRAHTKATERRLSMVIPWVFHRNGQPIKSYKDAWWAALERAARDAHGVIVRPKLLGSYVHDFRRTANLNLEAAGVTQERRMELLGQKTASINSDYLPESLKRLRTVLTQAAAAGYGR